MFINEVTALVPVLRDCHYAFAVYTAQRTKERWPLVLAAQNEKDMNDWVTIAHQHTHEVSMHVKSVFTFTFTFTDYLLVKACC